MILVYGLHKIKLVALNIQHHWMIFFRCAALKKQKQSCAFLINVFSFNVMKCKHHSLVWGIHARTHGGPKTRLSVRERRK